MNVQIVNDTERGGTTQDSIMKQTDMIEMIGIVSAIMTAAAIRPATTGQKTMAESVIVTEEELEGDTVRAPARDLHTVSMRGEERVPLLTVPEAGTDIIPQGGNLVTLLALPVLRIRDPATVML